MESSGVPPGKFSSQPAMRWVSRWEIHLIDELSFHDPVHGLITVPAGFVSDLASIRILRTICLWGLGLAAIGKFFLWFFVGLAVTLTWLSNACWFVAVVALALYALVVGYGARAAILHDWLYTVAELPRAVCDEVFERALRTGDGVAWWRSKGLFWTGVRIGGAGSYQTAAD